MADPVADVAVAASAGGGGGDGPSMEVDTEWSQDQILRLRSQLGVLRLLQRDCPVPSNLLTAALNGINGRVQDDFVVEDDEEEPCVSLRDVIESRRRIIEGKERRNVEDLKAILASSAAWSKQQKTKARIEFLKLSLVDKQRLLRESIVNELTEARLPSVHDLPLYVLRKEKQAVSTWQIEAEWKARKLKDVARIQKEARKNFVGEVVKHQNHFAETGKRHEAIRRGLCRDLSKYHQNKEKKAREQEKVRIQLLRSKDMDAYRKLVQEAKDQRIRQLLDATDAYLSKLGIKVQNRRIAQESEAAAAAMSQGDGGGAAAAAASSSGGGGGKEDKDGGEKEGQQQQQQDGKQVYQLQHMIQEKITEQPECIGNEHLRLRPYQLEGLQWLISLYNNNLNGILADEMGLGKTIQIVALLTYLVTVKKNNGPFLVIVPLSTMPNWEREFQTWAPELNVVMWYRATPKTEKRELYESKVKHCHFNVLVTQHDSVYDTLDTNRMSKIKWEHLIVDEGHKLKNQKCQFFKILQERMHTKRKLLLTGTPLQKAVNELWSLLNFLMPEVFDTHEDFEEWFNAPFTEKGQDVQEEFRLLIISQLHNVLRPFMLRRLKQDVEHSLQSVQEVVVRCDLSALQKILYAKFRHRILDKVADSYGVKGARFNFNNIQMQLRKICNHPFLISEYDFGDDDDTEILIRCCGKFDFLDRVLPKMKATGHRVLIYSQMVELLKMLAEFCELRQYSYRMLDGTTRPDEREKRIREYNQNRDIFLFLLSTRAGGQGINLQTADTVMIFDSDWNPMMDEQAKARVHRIGQEKAVLLVRLVTPNTVEETIYKRAGHRLRVDDLVIESALLNLKSSEFDSRELLEQKLAEESTNIMQQLSHLPVHSDEEINQMLARTPEEVEIFRKMDKERQKHKEEGWKRAHHGPMPPRLLTEDEVPSWISGGSFETGDRVRILVVAEKSAREEAAMFGTIKKTLIGERYLVATDEGEEKTLPRSLLAEIPTDEGLKDQGRGMRKRNTTLRDDTVSHGGLTDFEYNKVMELGMDINDYLEAKKARKYKRIAALQRKADRNGETYAPQKRGRKPQGKGDDGGIGGGASSSSPAVSRRGRRKSIRGDGNSRVFTGGDDDDEDDDDDIDVDGEEDNEEEEDDDDDGAFRVRRSGRAKKPTKQYEQVEEETNDRRRRSSRTRQQPARFVGFDEDDDYGDALKKRRSSAGGGNARGNARGRGGSRRVSYQEEDEEEEEEDDDDEEEDQVFFDGIGNGEEVDDEDDVEGVVVDCDVEDDDEDEDDDNAAAMDDD